MSAGRLRRQVARARRARRQAAREMNRVGVILARLTAHRDHVARGLDAAAPADEAKAAFSDEAGPRGRTGAAVLTAVESLVGAGREGSPEDRRRALAFLRDRLVRVNGPGGAEETTTFFRRASDYVRDRDAPSSLQTVVTALDGFVNGRQESADVVRAVRGVLANDPATAARRDDLVAGLGHLETLFGFAAEAARRHRDRVADRLNSTFQRTEIDRPGLLSRYLEAAGDDPFETLDEQPVVMFPVRLETRFVDPETGQSKAEGGDGPFDLRIRVFPDQVHVDVHEEELTDEEVRWGQSFWAHLWYACHPEPRYDGPSLLAMEGLVPDLGGGEDSPWAPRVTDAALRAAVPLGPVFDADKLDHPETPPHVLDVVQAVDDRRADFSRDGERRYREIKERAWRQLVDEFGRERAAYVVHAVRPRSHADVMRAGWVDGDPPWPTQEDAPRLTFPDVPRRPAEWTAQPTARLLPDRWIAYGTWRPNDAGSNGAADEVRHVQVTSHAVREPLAMGPDPETVAAMGAEAVGRDGTDDEGTGSHDDGLELVPSGMEWMVDFEEALRAGMALTITEDELGLDPADGSFETLVVFGVKTSLSADETPAALRELLDGHHYGDGLELLPPGTPTNNADVPAGYASGDDPIGSMDVEIGPPLVTDGDRSDGDQLARALALVPEVDGSDPGRPHVFAHVGNADGTRDRQARHMNNALWPATLGYYGLHLLIDARWSWLGSLWEDLEPAENGPPDDEAAAMRDRLAWAEAIRHHFIAYVRGGGPFPALRVGRQPYGILPAMPMTSARFGDDWLLHYDAKRMFALAFDGNENGDDAAELNSGTTGSRSVDLTGDDKDTDTIQFAQGVPFSAVSSGAADDDSAANGSAEDDADEEDRPQGDAGWVIGSAVHPENPDFTVRRLDSWNLDVHGQLVSWVDRLADAWRTTLKAGPFPADGDGGPWRPVPRITDAASVDEDTLKRILKMEANAGDYMRRDVFTDLDAIATSYGVTYGWGHDDSRDIPEEEIESLVEEAGRHMDRPEVRALLRRTDPEGVGEIRALLKREILPHQLEEIRKTLRRYDLTDLNPRIAHFLYDDVVPDEPGWRTVGRLVDDDPQSYIRLLTHLTYGELRALGRTSGDPDVPRPGILTDLDGEDVLPKSLLRILLRFSTMQEFVRGRIELGALYDDLVELGPDPVRPPSWRVDGDQTWVDELEDPVPYPLMHHPDLDYIQMPMGPARPGYDDALQVFRRPWTQASVMPSFGDFTYSLYQLTRYPTDRLETLVAETLDLASHRLDAWWTSAATRRLFGLRASQQIWKDEHRHRADPLFPVVPPKISSSLRLTVRTGSAENGGSEEPTGDAEESPDSEPVAETQGMVKVAGEETVLGTQTEGIDAAAAGEAVLEKDDDLTAPVVDTSLAERTRTKPGIYVGAYAFGEDLAPDHEDEEAEFLHAPSLQQATTAAMLRSGYQAHRDDELREAFTFDLSAPRVQTAMRLLEGVRNGQSLGALLGYRFERALKDNPSGIQDHIHDFRQIAPASAGKLRHAKDADLPATVGDPAAKSDVVDGYRLYRMWKGDEPVPSHVDAELKELFTQDEVQGPFKVLKEAIDALRDLLVAESVHQLAQGNFARASASVDAIAQGRHPPEPEVVKTPRRSRGLTNRQLILLGEGRDDGGADAADTNPWLGDAPGGPRAQAEPRLNAWLAELFPAPGRIACTAAYRWTDDAGEEQTRDAGTITMDTLGLSPLDFLYLTQEAADAGTSHLEGRIVHHLLRAGGGPDGTTRPPDLPPDAEVELRFTDAGSADAISVAEFLEVTRSLRDLILEARPLDGRDLAAPGDVPSRGHTAESANELATRADVAQTALDEIKADLADRTGVLEPPEGGPNLPARVDAAVESVGSLVGTLPASLVTSDESDGTPPTARDRFEAYHDRVSIVLDRLAAGDGTVGADDAGALLEDLVALRSVLPAGPTVRDDVEDELWVDAAPGQEVEGTVRGYEGGTGSDSTDHIEVRCFSRTMIDRDAFAPKMTTAAVDDEGGFAATFDFTGIQPGTPFRAIGQIDGTVVYSALGRVSGETPAPEETEERLSSSDMDQLAALIELSHLARQLRPDDDAAETLQHALDRLRDESLLSTVADEAAQMASLTGEQSTLTPAERGDVDDVVELVDVDLRSLASRLNEALAPLTKVGLSRLVVVTVRDRTARYWRGGDVEASRVRERLETVADDSAVLDPTFPYRLLGIDPRIARHFVDLLGNDDAVSLAGCLEAFVDASDSFPLYLDGFVPDAGALLQHVAQLLYGPHNLDDGDISALADGLRAVEAIAAERATDEEFDPILHPDVDADAIRFADLQDLLGDLVNGRDGEPGLAAFLRALEARGSTDETGFTLGYSTALEESASGVEGTLERLWAIVEADDPATSFRKGVYETVRHVLMKAASYGLYGAVPVSVDGGDPADEADLAGQVRAARDRVAKRIEAAHDAGEQAATATGAGDHEAAVKARIEQIQALFGKPFRALPTFTPPNQPELRHAFETSLLGDTPADQLAPEAWLQRVAHVRDRAAAFRDALSYAETVQGTLIRDLSVGQLPVEEGARWVGLPGVEPANGQVSMVVQPGVGFDVRTAFEADDATPSAPVAGLLVDEWVERVPEATETTSIALNYDDPGTRAPQSILLAVPRPERGWSEQELRLVVSETLGLAKLRLVDLEALAHAQEGAGFDHLLPALWFPRVHADRPMDPSVNFDELEWFEKDSRRWSWPLFDAFTGLGGSDGGEADEDGGEEP